MGMGVAIVGGAVRGPARVTDADAAGRGLVAEMADEVLNAAGSFAEMQIAAGQRRQAGTVVAAIFQPVQALNEDGFRFPGAGIADDAAHACSSLNGDQIIHDER